MQENILNYEEFKTIFENVISQSGKSKFGLIEKIGATPFRYIGIFRSLNAKSKILHNIFQSHEIKFGNALEAIITKYLEKLNYEVLNNKFEMEDPLTGKVKKLNVDIFFKKGNSYFLVEQKVRDDHDSTKKTGQISNFETKIDYALENILNENESLESFFYFIDPSFKKNSNFFKEKMEDIASNREIKIYLCYGKEIFEHLQIPKAWEEIKMYLTRWHSELEDIPNLNFDLDSKTSFEIISKLKTGSLINFFNNSDETYKDKIWQEIMPIFFPTGETIGMLINSFETSKHKSRNKLAKAMREKFNTKN